jgi:DeoR/GlpR family transcriptional regulator of sugar metabolism
MVVVKDHSKLGCTTLNQILPINAIKIVVTDVVEPSAELDAIRSRGVQVPAV